MRRVHLSDQIPYAVIDNYVDRDLYQQAPQQFDTEMVILVIESMPDAEIKSARQTLTIDVADVEVAELLEIAANAPVGRVRRVLQDNDGRILYVAEAVYRGRGSAPVDVLQSAGGGVRRGTWRCAFS